MLTGQSNSNAAHNAPTVALSTVDEYPGVALMSRTPDGIASWTDLTADLVNNLEWPGAALGYRISEALAGTVIVDPQIGFTGRTLAQISKGGGTFYGASIERLAQSVMTARELSHQQLALRAVHLVHGEAGDRDNLASATYRTQMETLRTDYRNDARMLTGYNAETELIVCQVPAWAEYSQPSPHIGLAQLAEHISNAHVHLVGGRYQLEGHRFDGVNFDDIHYNNIGIYHLGELHARVYKRVVIDAGTWEPLRPSGATLAGSVVTVQFLVPVAPLRWAPLSVTAYETNYGFTVASDSGAETISGVALGGDGTSVVVTLAAPPGANPKVRYGFQTQYGNLADSETAVSVHDGVRLSNWCVHFEQTVT